MARLPGFKRLLDLSQELADFGRLRDFASGLAEFDRLRGLPFGLLVLGPLPVLDHAVLEGLLHFVSEGLADRSFAAGHI